MGVILWHKIVFPDQKLKLSNSIVGSDYLVDAAVTVKYGIDEPGTVEIRLKDLPLELQEKIAAGLTGGKGKDGVKVQVHLGYLEDPLSGQAEVFNGRIESLSASTRFPPLGIALSGHEEAAFKLLTTTALAGEKPPPKRAHLAMETATPADAAEKILGAAGLKLVGEATPESPKRTLNVDADDAFAALRTVARTFDAEILVQDGKVLFGEAIQYPPETGPFPIPPNPALVLAFIVIEDCLVAIKGDKGMVSARMAEFRPVQIGSSKSKVVIDKPAKEDVQAFDFTVEGVPSLRAGQLVVASVIGYENPFKPFRILSLTHSYSIESGYTCTGRAVEFDADGVSNRARSERARTGSPVSVADRIAGKIKEGQATSPGVDVGRVKAAKPAERVATVQYRTSSSNAVPSPSVDLDIPIKDAPTLLSKPIAAPFAWHNVGLSVPVYEGMRALLNQVRSVRDDAVVTGFLWSNDPMMDRPPAHEGDWWLCLPTAVAGVPPLPTGVGANDLTAADGRRVIETPGLSIAVGQALCSPLGIRPTEGAANVLTIKHFTGTSIEINALGVVKVSATGVTLTVGNGKVAIT